MAKITIQNKTDKNPLVLYEGEIDDTNSFTYIEKETGALTAISFDDLGIEIIRSIGNTKTTLSLFEDSHGQVENQFGVLELEVVRLNYQRFEHRIVVDYRIGEDFSFVIEF